MCRGGDESTKTLPDGVRTADSRRPGSTGTKRATAARSGIMRARSEGTVGAFSQQQGLTGVRGLGSGFGGLGVCSADSEQQQQGLCLEAASRFSTGCCLPQQGAGVIKQHQPCGKATRRPQNSASDRVIVTTSPIVDRRKRKDKPK